MDVGRRGALASVLAVAGMSWAVSGTGCGGGNDRGAATKPARPEPSAPAAKPEPAAPAATSGDSAAYAKEQAEEIFATRCVTCHGEKGAGDGPGSEGLEPTPRNLQDPAWQASVTDEHISQIVLYGGAAVGKSVAMPSNPDLTSQPEVATALVAHIRGLGSE